MGIFVSAATAAAGYADILSITSLGSPRKSVATIHLALSLCTVMLRMTVLEICVSMVRALMNSS